LVIEFWASWSGPSRAALNEFAPVLKTFDEKEVQFLAVNLGEPASVVKPYYERNGWQFAVGLDDAEALKAQFAVESVPHTVVIDPQGQIVWSQGGFRPGAGQELAQVISTILSR
jgi:thiol-disulfide isomerase/thioredoxin